MASLFAHASAGSRSVSCEVVDVSLGGLSGRFSEALPAQERWTLSLARPGWHRALQINARRLEPRGGNSAGVVRMAFEGLEGEAAQLLAALLRGSDDALRSVPVIELHASEIIDAVEAPAVFDALELIAPPEERAPSPDVEVVAAPRTMSMRGSDSLSLRERIHQLEMQLAEAQKARVAAEQAVERLCRQMSFRR